MAINKFFITGTDTDVGKTLIAAALLVAAGRKGLSTAAIKPVAAGCTKTQSGLRNDDALLLQQHMSLQLPYDQINPVAFEPAIAPHIAAEQVGRKLRVAQLEGHCQALLMQKVDMVVVEGAGGWLVPVNLTETLADLARQLNIPVIMVVGVKLGCINHALLTMQAIARDGLHIAGWVANQVDNSMACYQENVATLRTLIAAPCIGEVPFLPSPAATDVADCLNIDLVIGK